MESHGNSCNFASSLLFQRSWIISLFVRQNSRATRSTPSGFPAIFRLCGCWWEAAESFVLLLRWSWNRSSYQASCSLVEWRSASLHSLFVWFLWKCRNVGRTWVCVIFFIFWDQKTQHPLLIWAWSNHFWFDWVQFLVMKWFSQWPNTSSLQGIFGEICLGDGFLWCDLQALVVLLLGLGHFLKMGHLGLVGSCWWEMNTVGTEVKDSPIEPFFFIPFRDSFIKLISLFFFICTYSLVFRGKYVVSGDTNRSWVLLFNWFFLLCGGKWQDHGYVSLISLFFFSFFFFIKILLLTTNWCQTQFSFEDFFIEKTKELLLWN